LSQHGEAELVGAGQEPLVRLGVGKGEDRLAGLRAGSLRQALEYFSAAPEAGRRSSADATVAPGAAAVTTAGCGAAISGGGGASGLGAPLRITSQTSSRAAARQPPASAMTWVGRSLISAAQPGRAGVVDGWHAGPSYSDATPDAKFHWPGAGRIS